MAPERVKPKSRSVRDLALAASTSQVTPQDSRTISKLCYLPASAVYENNHNNILADVDEDDDDDNDIYYNQDEQGVVNHADEQFYHMKIQELAERKFELFMRGKLVVDRKKKKKQIELFGIQDDLYACEDELVSKQNEMQIYKHQKVASSSRRPHKAVKDDSNEDNKKNNPKKKTEPIITNDITERLKEHITHQLNGTNIMLVIQKPLFASDLTGSQNRLSMPYNQLETSDFLTEQEKEYLLTPNSEIDVPLLGPTLQMFNQSMKLTRWQINSTHSYILRTNWKTFLQENKNDLKQGATIQVWSYRKEDQNEPCFAIAVVKRAD
ncbi:B3 domain-containing protein, DNA-binding pseudobarrel domain protein [Tanacetum coccineum]